MIEGGEGVTVPQGSLDITLYRDDLQTVGPRPVVGPTYLPWELDGKHVVIVDDVLYTGRTVRAALDELADFAGLKAHVAGITDRMWERHYQTFAKNLRHFVKGEPLRWVVDKESGY